MQILLRAECVCRWLTGSGCGYQLLHSSGFSQGLLNRKYEGDWKGLRVLSVFGAR